MQPLNARRVFPGGRQFRDNIFTTQRAENDGVSLVNSDFSHTWGALILSPVILPSFGIEALIQHKRELWKSKGDFSRTGASCIQSSAILPQFGVNALVHHKEGSVSKMATNTAAADIYSATYSNVPVFELKIGPDHVMRRRSDDWINATHILKIAGYDKPARTRILEKEVQKGVHEKIQGGYGKYQGTWIPLSDGRVLAHKNHILDRIKNIFDYVAGDRSPPPAPKHATAASSKPKTNRQPVPSRKPPAQPKASAKAARIAEAASSNSYYKPAEEQYEDDSILYEEDRSREITPGTAFPREEGIIDLSDLSTGTNYKRSKRKWDDGLPDAVGFATEYGDELLDYFVTAGDDPETSNLLPPTPPDGFDVNTPIDTLGNCAIHWACSMGDVEITRDLLARGANPAIQNHGCKETPLIRAVLFTNSYDKKSFHRIVEMLAGTIVERDSHGATVFHHIAETARSRGKWSSARYYCEVLINKMLEMGSNYVQTLLTSADENQDTPALCAIRNGCVKVATFLLNYCPEAGDIPNLKGETANDYLRALRDKRESLEQPPSSPLGRAGELSMNGTHRHGIRRRPLKQPVSRAASAMYESVGATFEEQRDRLASSFDAEITEKDTAIAESRQNLADLEAQRSKIRQDTYTLIARAGSDDENQLIALRQEYAAALRTIESLLEQKEHYTLQQRVRVQDQLSPVMSFRSANPAPLTGDELNAALPLAIELSRLQVRRKQLVIDIARLMGEVGTGEKLGKHRKLVAIATGIKEDELDGMSKELLESLQAGIPAGVGEGDGPKTPEGMVGVELA